MDVDRYLGRIDADPPPPTPSIDALVDLQVRHLLAVPFENLDIPAGIPISLAPEAMFDKVVSRRRGGFCYELNGLFGLLLRDLGYRVTMLSARTVDGVHGAEGPEFDHLVLRVDLDEPWLVDVGFGDSFRTPMPLRDDVEHTDPLGRTYRFEVRGDDWDLRERLTDDAEAPDVVDGLGPDAEWRTQFRFTLRPRELADFEATCRWQQTDSPFFTGHRFCTLATPDGRRTLMDDRLIVRHAGTRTERPVTEDEVPGLLLDRFGVAL
jgi:N-hydroxyarylamine O-acetyltransferase